VNDAEVRVDGGEGRDEEVVVVVFVLFVDVVLTEGGGTRA
jgi:hypothetical protein